jgi:hypothetical protein
MSERDVAPSDGLELAEAIGLLRDELLRARVAGAISGIQLPVESMRGIATRLVDGNARFAVPIVGVQVGGGVARESGVGQKVTMVFGGPMDRDGNPVKVASASDVLKG